MTDRPILFSAPMIRALLDGRKTQTRRVLKPQPTSIGDKIDAVLEYRVRDRLWVREQCATWIEGPETVTYPVIYAADDPEWDAIKTEARRDKPEWKVRTSIYMPRWASRLTLTVTNVRVQRLQDISEADAVAEGIEPFSGIDPMCNGYRDYYKNSAPGFWLHPRASFSSLWNSINGPDAWEANPWVAAITFTVQQGNIDMPAKMEAEQ